MAFSLAVSPSLINSSVFSLSSDFLPSTSLHQLRIDFTFRKSFLSRKKPKYESLSVSCSAPKIVRDRSLDKHIVKQNKTRFVQKLKTLLLSKPKHFIPIKILSKCRSYLGLPKPRSLLSMIYRYPTIFELFTIPYPPTPMNATQAFPQLCVRLSPAAEALTADEARFKKTASVDLAAKLQKLLMLSTHRRLLLSKLVHLGPDLGLPPNFRSCLCNEYPEKFKIVDTSYGRALELVSWDSDLANLLPKMKGRTRDLIVDRPLKFKHLSLRKGLNLKRPHTDFLIKFEELPDICPYKTLAGDFSKESIESEKRACGVVREVLGMTLEKRTLVDHLTHFRADFGLPNKLRGMLVRHPELFYISLKGERDSTFLVEAYDDNGVLTEKDDAMVLKERLFTLVMEGKRIRRGRRQFMDRGSIDLDEYHDDAVSNSIEEYNMGSTEEDEIDQLFDWDDPNFETWGDDDDDDGEYLDSSQAIRQKRNFWTTDVALRTDAKNAEPVEPW